ncbi:hypothetical protein SSBR45G_10310 [Bradyrhizobium sp. SSBR45G]|uniref:hypothetical protein n=1 Tax=unclassified Bradyrhizobium TaxID=2631580 RepID=UPI002342A0FF|nr:MULTISPECIES: hypothetical protein [unclassified Bradyrhizobium]GLH76123.1 hypothetical protein SSBR45G_10310 [Bradyrhizobium sp. SSBR45G]GLH83393.1 hypothetical protein SSBR45R_08530 [Bradyrhizobium sp. SSBR45R]
MVLKAMRDHRLNAPQTALLLNAIEGDEIAQRRCSTIDSTDLVELASQPVRKVKPPTASSRLVERASPSRARDREDGGKV